MFVVIEKVAMVIWGYLKDVKVEIAKSKSHG